MDTGTVALLAALILAASILYSSVGHAGASGYLAVMALFGVSAVAMKPTALTLNIIVAAIATYKFYRAGYFSWKILWPFAVASIPASFIGGYITLPGHWYKTLVGIILLLMAVYLVRYASRAVTESETNPIPIWAALLSGAIIGLLAGLTGTGGGIFLSPLLLFMGWSDIRTTSGLAAAFILVNSIAGLLGNYSSVGSLPGFVSVLVLVVIVGGYVGAEYGSKHIGGPTLRRLLAAVLVIAGLKLIFV